MCLIISAGLPDVINYYNDAVVIIKFVDAAVV